MAEPNPYDILGLPQDADLETVKATYRRLAKHHHPDRADDAEKDQAAAHFRRIAEAYRSILSLQGASSSADASKSNQRGPTATHQAIRVICSRCGGQIDPDGMIAYSTHGEPCHPACVPTSPPIHARPRASAGGNNPLRTTRDRDSRRFTPTMVAAFFVLVIAAAPLLVFQKQIKEFAQQDIDQIKRELDKLQPESVLGDEDPPRQDKSREEKKHISDSNSKPEAEAKQPSSPNVVSTSKSAPSVRISRE